MITVQSLNIAKGVLTEDFLFSVEGTQLSNLFTVLVSGPNDLPEMDVRGAFHTLTSSIRQTKILEKALVATEQNYQEQKKDYSYGLVTNLDVLQALNSFQETKRSLDRLRFQVMASWAELKATVGQIPSGG